VTGAARGCAIVGESRIVFQRAQILPRRRHHGLGLDAEVCEAIDRAHTVDGQRAIVVGGKRPTRHEVHDEALHASQEVGQTEDPAAAPREFRHQLDNLAQRIDPGTAEGPPSS